MFYPNTYMVDYMYKSRYHMRNIGKKNILKDSSINQGIIKNIYLVNLNCSNIYSLLLYFN